MARYDVLRRERQLQLTGRAKGKGVAAKGGNSRWGIRICAIKRGFDRSSSE